AGNLLARLADAWTVLKRVLLAAVDRIQVAIVIDARACVGAEANVTDRCGVRRRHALGDAIAAMIDIVVELIALRIATREPDLAGLAARAPGVAGVTRADRAGRALGVYRAADALVCLDLAIRGRSAVHVLGAADFAVVLRRAVLADGADILRGRAGH